MADISINEMWSNALSAYSAGNKRSAIDIFSLIAKADARISFNLACIYIEDKNYPVALQYLKDALEMDKFLAVGYFQRAHVRYQQGRFDSAHKNYIKTILVRIF